MRRAIPICLMTCFLWTAAGMPAAAQQGTRAGTPAPAAPVLAINPPLPEGIHPLEGLKWINRVLVVFADSDRDPRFARQMKMLRDDPAALIERDVVVLTDTDPRGGGPLRQRLRPRDFMLVLIGKDGTVALRKPDPRSVREIVRVIDKMPLRLQEIEEAKRAAAEAAQAAKAARSASETTSGGAADAGTERTLRPAGKTEGAESGN